MKLFLGMKVPDQLLKDINTWREQNKGLNVRWLSENDMHLTILPPWEERDPVRASALLVELDPVPDFTISFDTISLGPDPREPRLIWALGDAPRDLIAYKDRAERVFGMPHRKDFKLHLTLARMTDRRLRFEKQKVNWTDSPKSLVLFESMGGSTYRRISEI